MCISGFIERTNVDDFSSGLFWEFPHQDCVDEAGPEKPFRGIHSLRREDTSNDEWWVYCIQNRSNKDERTFVSTSYL
jgi:hypothetical protein